MFKQVRRRVVAGVLALAVILSNVIMPAGSAFADGGQQNNGTYQPVWCKITGNHWTVKQGQSGGANSWALLMTDAIRTLGNSNVDTSVANGQQVMEHDRSDKIDASYCATQFTLTIPAPAVTVVCGPNNDIVTLTNNSNYTWSFGSWKNGSGSVTVTANTPYTFTDGKTKEVLPVTDQNTSCVTTITQLPKSTVTGVCGINNDTITVGVETNQYSKGIATVFTNGTASVTYTAKSGFVFANGPGVSADGSTYTETVKEVIASNCKDATASVGTTDPTCDKAGIASVNGLANATLTSNGGTLNQTVGTHTAVFTALAGHAFANGASTLNVQYTIADHLTGRQCAGPQPKDDHETRIITGKPVCSPNGGGTVTSWTEERHRSYHYNEDSNSWVAGSWSNWAKVPESEKTVSATEDQCPSPKQTQPNCDRLGSLTLPAYKGDGRHNYSYVVTIGLTTKTYSADHAVTITGIAQGAKVLVKLVSDDCFHTVVWKKEYCFNYANCIAIPETPSQNDPCGPRNATWIIPADTTDVHWSLDQTGHLIATTVSGLFTNGKSTIDFGVTTDSNKPCPAHVTPCSTANAPITVTKASDFADYQDTRTSGLYGFVTGGLKIWTTDNTSQAKVAWYHLNNYPLAAIGTPSMNYTMDTSAGLQQIAPGFQIVVDFNGDGSAMGTLVGESVYGNSWWLTNSSSASVKANAPHTGGGNGSNWFGTLDEWLTNFPNAKVTAVGFSLGSGVYAGGTLHSLTFGCQTWNFTAPENPGKGGETPTPTSTLELPHTGPTSSINYLLLGMITAVTIYGAIYFAQPKKLHE